MFDAHGAQGPLLQQRLHTLLVQAEIERRAGRAKKT